MRGHIHTDALHIVVLGTGVFLYAHAMRVMAAWIGAHGSQGLGSAIGGFFTLSGGG